MAVFPWLGAPDWSDGLTETLEWKTDVLQSPTGAEQRVARRLTPRRYFELTTVCAGVERGAFQNWLARAGAMEWAIAGQLYLYEVPKTLTGVTVYPTAEELVKSL